MTRVLAVDDEPDILKILSMGLRADGFEVVEAMRADQAIEILDRDRDLDAAILDIQLSSGREGGQSSDDGLTLLQKIRSSSTIPVMMLSSTDLESVKVLALNMGADDYMTKPFGAMEVGARLRAILRRRNLKEQTSGLKLGALRVDLDRREVHLGDSRVDLTQTEFEVLAALAEADGRVLSRRQIVDVVWGESHFVEERVVDVHIRHLRKKIERDPSDPGIVLTVRGVGYRIGESES